MISKLNIQFASVYQFFGLSVTRCRIYAKIVAKPGTARASSDCKENGESWSGARTSGQPRSAAGAGAFAGTDADWLKAKSDVGRFGQWEGWTSLVFSLDLSLKDSPQCSQCADESYSS